MDWRSRGEVWSSAGLLQLRASKGPKIIYNESLEVAGTHSAALQSAAPCLIRFCFPAQAANVSNPVVNLEVSLARIEGHSLYLKTQD